jgi:hypothetical protein
LYLLEKKGKWGSPTPQFIEKILLVWADRFAKPVGAEEHHEYNIRDPV